MHCRFTQISNPRDEQEPKTFTFDQVYDWNSTQMEIFDVTARPIVDSCMEGYNGEQKIYLTVTLT